MTTLEAGHTRFDITTSFTNTSDPHVLGTSFVIRAEIDGFNSGMISLPYSTDLLLLREAIDIFMRDHGIIDNDDEEEDNED